MKSKQKRKGFFSSIKSLLQRKKTSEAPTHDAGSIAVTKGRYKGNPDLLLMGYNTLALTAGNKTDRIEAIRTYEQMLLDDKISQVFQIVNSSVRSLSWSIEAENTDVARFIKDCLLKLDFKNFVGNLLTARAFGFALFEEIWSTDSSPNSMQFYTIKSEKLLPYDKVDFVMDDYANLVGIEVNGESRPLHWFHRFTYPEVKPESYFYGVSDLTKIHREWYTKDVLKKYRNIGLENFAFPIVLVTFDQYKYRRGSQEWDKLWELVNGIKNDARLMVPGSRNISEMAGILPDVDIKFLEPSFGGSGFNAFETAIESENKAIARNLGMPDNLGYSDVGSGSYAKSQTEYDLYWRNVVDIAEAVQDSVQEVVERLLRYNYPTERARFVFDLSRDKGITQEKVAIFQGMIAAGVKPTKEYVAGFLDLGESDFDLNLDTVVINPASVGGNTQVFEASHDREQSVSEGAEEFDSKKKDSEKTIVAYRYVAKVDSKTSDYCSEHNDMVISADDKSLLLISPPNHPHCRSRLEPIYEGESYTISWKDGKYKQAKGYGENGSVEPYVKAQKLRHLDTVSEGQIFEQRVFDSKDIANLIFYKYFPGIEKDIANSTETEEHKIWREIRKRIEDKQGATKEADEYAKRESERLRNKRKKVIRLEFEKLEGKLLNDKNISRTQAIKEIAKKRDEFLKWHTWKKDITFIYLEANAVFDKVRKHFTETKNRNMPVVPKKEAISKIDNANKTYKLEHYKKELGKKYSIVYDTTIAGDAITNPTTGDYIKTFVSHEAMGSDYYLASVLVHEYQHAFDIQTKLRRKVEEAYGYPLGGEWAELRGHYIQLKYLQKIGKGHTVEAKRVEKFYKNYEFKVPKALLRRFPLEKGLIKF